MVITKIKHQSMHTTKIVPDSMGERTNIVSHTKTNKMVSSKLKPYKNAKSHTINQIILTFYFGYFKRLQNFVSIDIKGICFISKCIQSSYFNTVLQQRLASKLEITNDTIAFNIHSYERANRKVILLREILISLLLIDSEGYEISMF